MQWRLTLSTSHDVKLQGNSWSRTPVLWFKRRGQSTIWTWRCHWIPLWRAPFIQIFLRDNTWAASSQSAQSQADFPPPPCSQTILVCVNMWTSNVPPLSMLLNVDFNVCCLMKFNISKKLFNLNLSKKGSLTLESLQHTGFHWVMFLHWFWFPTVQYFTVEGSNLPSLLPSRLCISQLKWIIQQAFSLSWGGHFFNCWGMQ